VAYERLKPTYLIKCFYNNEEIRVKGPEIRVKGPEIRVKGPEMWVKGPEIRVKGPERLCYEYFICC